jgi:hypothetical protein
MPNQTSLNLSTQPTGPVECLRQTFPSEAARREHYLGLLAEKLKDPEFRKIEGFPIGEDEDILALSDPPYYTACPNPGLATSSSTTDGLTIRRRSITGSLLRPM